MLNSHCNNNNEKKQQKKTFKKKKSCGHLDMNPHPKDCKATVISTMPGNPLDISDKIFLYVTNRK